MVITRVALGATAEPLQLMRRARCLGSGACSLRRLGLLLALYTQLPRAATLRLFGGPSHLTRRETSTKFWALDVSGGVGTISSPVIAEHPKNASEAAMFYERVGSSLASVLPPWLLLSTVGVVTRELASRQVQQGVVPALVSTNEAQLKSGVLAKKLRTNFDDRIQRVLAPGGYGDAQRLVSRFVDAELRDLEATISGIDDIISNEITQAVMEVVEVETVGRIQAAISDVVQLNQSSAAQDLGEIMSKADADGNGILTLDEVYELISGAPIDPLLAPLASSLPVLKSERSATSRWDLWGSLLIAPQVKNAAKASALLRRLYERGERQSSRALIELAKAAADFEVGVRAELGSATATATATISESFGVSAPTTEAPSAAAAVVAAAADADAADARPRSQLEEPRRRWWRPWTWLKPRRRRRRHRLRNGRAHEDAHEEDA